MTQLLSRPESNNSTTTSATAPWWPGLAWHEGDPETLEMPAPAFRQYIWLVHEASPVLFAAVGNNANISFTNQEGIPKSGRARDTATFIEAFLNDRFIATSNDGRANTAKLDRFNLKPHFFTINGQSGHFAHNHASITPMNRVGEPCSDPRHQCRAVDPFHAHPRQPRVRDVRRQCAPGKPLLGGCLFPASHGSYGLHPALYAVARTFPMKGGSAEAAAVIMPCSPWPTRPSPGSPAPRPTRPGRPWKSSALHHPKIGTIKKGFLGGTVDIAQRQSPLCFPMHSHSEPDQVSPGRQLQHRPDLGDVFHRRPKRLRVTNFPIDEDFMMMLDMGGSTSATGPAAGKEP